MSRLEEAKVSLTDYISESPINLCDTNQESNEKFLNKKSFLGRITKKSFFNRLIALSLIAKKDLAILHRKASRTGKIQSQNNCSQKCQCCEFYADKPLFGLLKGYKQYKELGIAYVLYFEYLGIMIIFLLLFFFIVCLPSSIGYMLNVGFYDRDNYVKNNSDSKISRWQVYLQCFGIILVMLGYPILKNILKRRIVTYYNDKIITEQNFTILIKNLPVNYTNRELKEHFDKYLPFDSGNYKTLIVVNCYDLSKIIDIAKKINETHARLSFLKAYKYEYDEDFKEGFISKKVVSIEDVEKELEILESSYQEILEAKGKKMSDNLAEGKKRYQDEDQRERKSTNSAFVYFRKSSYAQMLKEELNYSILRHLNTILLPRFLQQKTVYRFKEKYIYSETTPETSDVNWENANDSKCKKYFIRAIILLLTISLLLIFYIFILFPLAEYAFDKKVEGGQSTTLSVFISSVSVLINFIGEKTLLKLSLKESNTSYTKFYLSLYKKYAGYMILNTIGIQFMLLIPSLNSTIKVHYVEIVLSLLISNSLIVPTLTFLQSMIIDQFAFFYFKNKKHLNMTQSEANTKFEFPEIDLSYDLAISMLVIYLGICISPILPEGIPIVILSLILQGFFFNIKLARFSKIPRYLDASLVLLALESFPWVLLPYSFSVSDFYYKEYNYDETFFIMVCLSIIYLLFLFLGVFKYLYCCISIFLRKTNQNIQDDKMFFDFYKKFISDYESENPATSLNGLERWDAYNKNENETEFVETEYKFSILDCIKSSLGNYFN
ncbi:hypothetical protein SteCoe_19226 [Stentor coeruleus]|uniref:CSC1/OSCA1-like cytosolic domain-containing protein n=1 Tax=Stentor coeruleus TaxID=5963 RepID=A0A1R2BUN1_9CILI|nr:hypothetical protein SteCoe_19226 [Stentor coeruleus]